jgi:antitoxin component of MazEF toxin-antitoxin module
MKSRIVQIGNSRGVRLPKVLLEQSQLADEVEKSKDDDSFAQVR